ncbi:ArsR family transcriptional regulator [Janibacter melonis]|uniref:ArsR family transcriptional regulator n=1 Tax=Janibacter melonis TaxID=262209 RepID=UPI00174AD1B8|nr:ArsR family transcriptional regulator [Janibacter melonis]
MRSTATDTHIKNPGTIPEEARSSGDDSRAEAMRLTGRNYTKVRHLLVQQPRGSATRTSTLGIMVASRKHRALLLYLLLLTLWPGVLKNRREPLEGPTWARLLSTETSGMAWTPSDVSRAWGDLERLHLIERTRQGRALQVKPRREDGKKPWTDPGLVRSNREETYFILPGAFWTDHLFAELSLGELAMLLIIAAETSKDDEVHLTAEQVHDWYGISASTAKKGFNDLVQRGLANRRVDYVKAPLSSTGTTAHHYYSLTGSYSSGARAAARQKAAQAAEKRRSQSGSERTAKKIKDKTTSKASRPKRSVAHPTTGGGETTS